MRDEEVGQEGRKEPLRSSVPDRAVGATGDLRHREP
jgi:hypothetical protein